MDSVGQDFLKVLSMKSQSFHTSRATFSDFYFRRWSDFQRVLALIALKLDPPAFSDPIRLLDWCFPGFSLAGYYRFFDGQHASHVAKHAGLAGTLVLSIVDIEKVDSPQNRHVTAVTCDLVPKIATLRGISRNKTSRTINFKRSRQANE